MPNHSLTTWFAAGALNAALLFPLSPMPGDLAVDGGPGEWGKAAIVEPLTPSDRPADKSQTPPRVAIAWDGTNLCLLVACPWGRAALSFTAINLPFSDALWRRGDRMEWIVRAGGEVFHHVFTPAGDAFRIIYKAGGFEEGHASDFVYKTRITDTNWCGEVKIPIVESPFPLPKNQPQWEMKILITQLKNGQTFSWPPGATDSRDSGYGRLEFDSAPASEKAEQTPAPTPRVPVSSR